jgi:hypothetical protein
MSDNESVLGQHFIAQGAKRVAEDQLAKTGEALARGSKEVAETHLGKGLDALKTFGENLTSPRLSATENIEWKRLRDLDYGSMSETQKADLKLLNNKALGTLEKFLNGEKPLEFPSK